MNELTQEWVSKAEDDFKLAYLAMEAGEMPIPSGVCFHAQQCAEKYLKAFLQEHQINFPRRHDLIPLLEMCLHVNSTFENLRDALVELEGYAVAIRYPGTSISVELAKSALVAVNRVRPFVRNLLGLMN